MWQYKRATTFVGKSKVSQHVPRRDMKHRVWTSVSIKQMTNQKNCWHLLNLALLYAERRAANCCLEHICEVKKFCRPVQGQVAPFGPYSGTTREGEATPCLHVYKGLIFHPITFHVKAISNRLCFRHLNLLFLPSTPKTYTTQP